MLFSDYIRLEATGQIVFKELEFKRDGRKYGCMKPFVQRIPIFPYLPMADR
jgi:hypothetical protein